MDFLNTVVKIKTFFDLFRKKPADSADGKEGKGKRIALIISLVLAGILLVVGIALLVKKLKQRRLEKEALEALDDYYSTDYDADEYDVDGDEEEA